MCTKTYELFACGCMRTHYFYCAYQIEHTHKQLDNKTCPYLETGRMTSPARSTCAYGPCEEIYDDSCEFETRGEGVFQYHERIALEAKKAAEEEKMKRLILGEIGIEEYERDKYDRNGDLDMGMIDDEPNGRDEERVVKESRVGGEMRGGSRTDESGHIMNTAAGGDIEGYVEDEDLDLDDEAFRERRGDEYLEDEEVDKYDYFDRYDKKKMDS